MYLLFIDWNPISAHVVTKASLMEGGFLEVLTNPCTLPMSGSQSLFEWEILHEQKLCLYIPRTTKLWFMNMGIVIKLSVFRPGNGTEFSSASLCSIKKCKEDLWEHKGKARVALNFWFYCAWLCWVTVKTIYVLWAWQRVSPPLPFTPEVNKRPTSQIRMRGVITRAVLFSGTWVTFRRKTGLDNIFLLWVFKIRLTNTLNNRCTGRIWGSD